MVRELPVAPPIGGRPGCGEGVLDVGGAREGAAARDVATGAGGRCDQVVSGMARRLCGRGRRSPQPGGAAARGGVFGRLAAWTGAADEAVLWSLGSAVCEIRW